MIDQPAARPLARTFVLRVVLDEQAQFHGQASEPGSPDQWHITVSSLAELQAGLERRLAGTAERDLVSPRQPPA